MGPLKLYTLGDFAKFGTEHSPTELASLLNGHVYQFENKTFVDNSEQTRKATLLFIGRYFYTKDGGPLTWALVTVTGITYYSGKFGRVCKPIPTASQAKIYQDYPFDLMFNHEGSNWRDHGFDPTQKVKESVFEAAINFAFFFTSRLDCVDNAKGTDMLNNFKFACLNFHRNKVGVIAKTSQLLPSRTLEVPNTAILSHDLLPQYRREHYRDVSSASVTSSTTFHPIPYR